MTQVNLLPPETRTKQRVRRYTLAATGAVAAVVVLLVGVYSLQSLRLASAGHDLTAQQRVNQGLQQQISTLQPFDQLRQQVVERETLTRTLLNGQVLWSGGLRDVSSSLPGGLWLTSMTVTMNPVTPGGAAVPSNSGAPVIGTVQFQGQAFKHVIVGDWLNRLEQVPGWVNAWV